MVFRKGCKMSVFLIEACFYFSYKIIGKYRLQGTCGGHLLHICIAAFPTLWKYADLISFVRQNLFFIKLLLLCLLLKVIWVLVDIGCQSAILEDFSMSWYFDFSGVSPALDVLQTLEEQVLLPWEADGQGIDGLRERNRNQFYPVIVILPLTNKAHDAPWFQRLGLSHLLWKAMSRL